MLRQANRRRYHYIYKTTCIVTGKYYLGMHSTDDLHDGYVGSGKRLGYSIRKHGKGNHVVEILEHYFTREWLKEREAELVCAEKLTDPQCMNLKLGGEGGFEHINATGLNNAKSKEVKLAAHQKAWNTLCDDPTQLAELKARSAAWMTQLHEDGRTKQFVSGSVHHKKALMAAKTESAKIKQKEAFAVICHSQGIKNSQYGTCWINNGTKAIKIKNVDLETYIGQGWLKGRK